MTLVVCGLLLIAVGFVRIPSSDETLIFTISYFVFMWRGAEFFQLSFLCALCCPTQWLPLWSAAHHSPPVCYPLPGSARPVLPVPSGLGSSVVPALQLLSFLLFLLHSVEDVHFVSSLSFRKPRHSHKNQGQEKYDMWDALWLDMFPDFQSILYFSSFYHWPVCSSELLFESFSILSLCKFFLGL